jgi:hypothetical protein
VLSLLISFIISFAQGHLVARPRKGGDTVWRTHFAKGPEVVRGKRSEKYIIGHGNMCSVILISGCCKLCDECLCPVKMWRSLTLSLC